jgi:hypothetical protein
VERLKWSTGGNFNAMIASANGQLPTERENPSRARTARVAVSIAPTKIVVGRRQERAAKDVCTTGEAFKAAPQGQVLKEEINENRNSFI